MFSNLIYLKDELRYGVGLYVNGWKKLLLHPIQTLKDIAYALCHPIETAKIVLNELKQHPIGMAFNIGLSWSTGHTIGSSIRLFQSLKTSSTLSGLIHNSTIVSDPTFSSVSQVVQAGSKTMIGSCCGGICTTATRLGRATSLISSQTATASMQH